ncbi:lantibiotic dehydratase family protein [Flavobacterium sp. FlaQc-48]|uniref:lantibiotic dehydratase family protein n=1 Tax=Flavobacterium sp. FlaQc-48 TaxID=3374181 RepID=UPI003756986A
MNKDIPYKHFENYILRSPLKPLAFFKSLTATQEINNEHLIKILDDPAINESLYLASPEFYNEILKWKTSPQNKTSEDKIKYSFLKYLSRLSSRCTPFGLFAGCAIGTISNSTNIVLEDSSKNLRHTRFDMNFLVALAHNIENIDFIKQQLIFSPNKTIYQVGKNIRYIEYVYINGKRNHQIASLYNSKYIAKILAFSKNGAFSKDIAKVITDENIDTELANEFINDLIANQILISNIEPSVVGIEFYDQIIEILTPLENTANFVNDLKKIKKLITNLDNSIGNPILQYNKIISLVQNLETDFDSKYLFQTDMTLTTSANTISVDVIEEVKKAISLLNKLSVNSENKNLSDFKKLFLTRYESREVSLAHALDTEIGIGYLQTGDQGDLNPLIDDLNFVDHNKKNTSSHSTSTYNQIIHKKIINAYINNDYIVSLNESDFSNDEIQWNNLPDTMSTIIELVNVNGYQKIKFDNIGGSSGANLLARFCHGDENIHQHVKNMIDIETKINENRILAEIVHLPEARIGNILARPALREYEIPYLGNSIANHKFQIQISDLYVSIKNNKVVLRSKKHNKEVIPRLTNAHNYSNLSLPIYHFLCDLQTSEKRTGLTFDLGSIASEYSFIPRIEFGKIILHEATWLISTSILKSAFNDLNNDRELEIKISIFQKEYKIPNLILLVEGDNQLLINLKNITSVKMFLDIIKSREQFKIIEFLFSEDSVVKNKNNEYYSNQIVLSFYNDEKLKQ